MTVTELLPDADLQPAARQLLPSLVVEGLDRAGLADVVLVAPLGSPEMSLVNKVASPEVRSNLLCGTRALDVGNLDVPAAAKVGGAGADGQGPGVPSAARLKVH